MAQHETTRRAVISALMAVPVMAISTVAVAQGSPDAELIQSWNARQKALAAIEANGSFFKAETHSPAATKRFDDAEMRVFNLPAKTVEGAILKLWVALAHSGGQMQSDEQRAQWDTIRRADLAAVESFADDVDFDTALIFQSIRALSAIGRG